jgi:hypothetical protein
MTAGEPSMPCRLTAANCVAFVSCPSISDFTRRSGRDGKLAVQGAVRVQGSEMPSSVLKSNAHDEAAMWRPNAGELKKQQQPPAAPHGRLGIDHSCTTSDSFSAAGRGACAASRLARPKRRAIHPLTNCTDAAVQ